ncbi:transposase (fragment) [Mesorhizobium prunaredense]|uniref:Transposase n=1 Tax=Mesorhizobium prunaredense TaxID=1631249 RepID=A0A1R3V832_9HYPH
MTAPLSKKLRERIVFAIEAGESCRSVAARFGIAVSSVVKWTQRYRMSGSIEPRKMSGRRRRVLDPHRDFIQERIAKAPHLTLHQLKAELEAHGVKVSHDTIWQFLRREGLSFKVYSSSVQASRGDASAWP